MYLLIFGTVFREFLVRLISFPLWWYTFGYAYVGRRIWVYLKHIHERLVPELWLRYLFVPMFGQYDWQGRIVSVGIRLCNAVIRGMLLCLVGAGALVIFCLWALVPFLWVVAVYRTWIMS